jgi:hypothetical protein
MGLNPFEKTYLAYEPQQFSYLPLLVNRWRVTPRQKAHVMVNRLPSRASVCNKEFEHIPRRYNRLMARATSCEKEFENRADWEDPLPATGIAFKYGRWIAKSSYKVAKIIVCANILRSSGGQLMAQLSANQPASNINPQHATGKNSFVVTPNLVSLVVRRGKGQPGCRNKHFSQWVRINAWVNTLHAAQTRRYPLYSVKAKVIQAALVPSPSHLL